MHTAAYCHSEEEQRKKDGEEKQTERDANEWPAEWMDSSVPRHVQIVTLLTNRIMKKTNLITVLKLWLITALRIGRTGKQLTDSRESGLLFNHSRPSLWTPLCRFEGYGVEITMFEVAQVDVCDTSLLISISQPLPWACPRQRGKKNKLK